MANQSKQESQEQKEYLAKDKAFEEGAKLYYDACKHLTTINTGSILILITFLEKVFTNPQWKFLIIVALLSFILSIVDSIRSMHNFANSVLEFGEISDEENKRRERIYYRSIRLFLIGIISLAIFAVRNFYG